MQDRLRLFMAASMLVMILGLWSCYVYEPYPPPPYPPYPAAFDRSWSAALAACDDLGIRILSADRGQGIIRGSGEGSDVTITVQTQADGRVRVQFNTKSPAGHETGLSERLSRAYDRRMGRY